MRQIFESTAGIVDVDWYVEDPQPKIKIRVDSEKAVLAGIRPEMIAQELRMVGPVRYRPIVLTAAALVVGGLVLVLDPIFQGLAVSMIFGVVVSTALTLVVIPLVYYIHLKVTGPAPAAADLG